MMSFAETILAPVIFLTTFFIFLYGIYAALIAFQSGQEMTPVMWVNGKRMLIFIAIGLILVTALHMAKFSLWLQTEDVVEAVITAAYAITLVGVHRGIDILLKEEPLHLEAYVLFIFLVVGGCFIVAMLFVKKRLEPQSPYKGTTKSNN